ncbi:MAG: hypothetical protein EOO35_00515 [Cyanobacteriota bacterium]|nr:MAG: hypothetical protein EOO35_00515 [Cyanobacteriota bacterium]
MVNTKEIPKNNKIKKDFPSVNRWYVKNVKIDPCNSIQFKDCYFSYLNYAVNEMEVAPCSKKLFGAAIRNKMRKLLDNGTILESRTSGLRFHGIKVKDIDSDRSRFKKGYDCKNGVDFTSSEDATDVSAKYSPANNYCKS